MADAQHRLALILEAKNQASATLKQVQGDVSSLGGGLRNLYSVAGQVMPGLNMLLTGGLIGGGVMAGRWLWNTTMDLAEVGAQADRTADAFERRIAGDATAALEKLREASQGTISDADLMAAATRGAMLGVSNDADTLAGLMEVAARRGRDLGMSTANAFSDLMTGLGRISTPILDNLAIMVDAEATYGAYAASIGKSAEALTDLEKRQALVNRVLQEATGDLGPLDTAGQLEAQAAAMANMKTEWGRFWAEMVVGSGVIGELTRSLQEATNELREYREGLEHITGPAERFDQAIDDAARSGKIGANVAEDYRRKLGLLYTAYEEGTLSLDDYKAAVDDLYWEMFSIYHLAEDWHVAFRAQRQDLDELGGAAEGAAASFDPLIDSLQGTAQAAREMMDDVRAAQLLLGMEEDTRGPLERWAQQYADLQEKGTEIRSLANRNQEQLDEEAERAAEEHASEMERLYEEQQASLRSMAESILTPTTVTPADMFRGQTGALGGYVDKWDESARRLDDIANRGMQSPWWRLMEVPADVLAEGERAVQVWAMETADAVRRGVRPDLVDWEAFVRAAEEFIRDQEAREQTVAMAMARLGGTVPEAEVRAMLGVQADAETEALAVGQAFQQGLGGVDLASAVTDRFHEQIQAQMSRWVAMGSMTVSWFAQGLEEGVGGDTGLRIAKTLWPMLVPMIDSYLERGVWN